MPIITSSHFGFDGAKFSEIADGMNFVGHRKSPCECLIMTTRSHRID